MLGPRDGIFFRARTTNVLEVDEDPDKWYLQARVVEESGETVAYRTESFEPLYLWQAF